MRATRGLPAAFVVMSAVAALAATASASPGAGQSAGVGPPAPALRVAAVPADSSTSDSTRADAKPAFALGDSLPSIETRLAELDSSRAGLPEKDRRVFDELVAASREMYEAGDLEAARLAIDDALLFLQWRPR
jgi:hypothetical protein